MLKIAPSILSANFARMGEEIKRMETAGADWIHCDVMDGVFVPNITFGIKMVEDIRKCTSLPLDVHLMIVNPEKYVERFMKAGADYLSFHYEASDNPVACLKTIRSGGVKAGIVISPDTPVEVLRPIIAECDFALLMSVYPGFGGQKFIPAALQRMKELKALRDELNPNCLLEIDGGINVNNAAEVHECGAQIAVAGNAVFGAADAAEAISALRGE